MRASLSQERNQSLYAGLYIDRINDLNITKACNKLEAQINNANQALRNGEVNSEEITATAYAYYYVDELIKFLECIKNNPNTPQDSKSKIELGISNLRKAQQSVNQLGIEMAQNIDEGKKSFFHKILDYVSNTIRNLLSSLLRITWGVIASAPL